MLRARRGLPGVRDEAIHFTGKELASKSVDGPLLKLLKRNVCRGRVRVKVEAMRIVEILVLWCSKLLLAVVNDIPPLGVDSVEVLPQHVVVVFVERCYEKCHKVKFWRGCQGDDGGERKVGDATLRVWRREVGPCLRARGPIIRR